MDRKIKQFKKEALETVRGWGFEGRKMVEVPPTFFERDDTLYISAEVGDGLLDYYGEFRGYMPYINEALLSLAKKYDLYIEWVNPGYAGVYLD